MILIFTVNVKGATCFDSQALLLPGSEYLKTVLITQPIRRERLPGQLKIYSIGNLSGFSKIPTRSPVSYQDF